MKAGRPSVTARVVAHARAGLDRPEVPTGDAAAERRLYESLGRSPLPETRTFRDRMARRTRFFDEATLAALGNGIDQVAIVGAGYDGRPLRFATPGVLWYEVDHPDTQADKRARLASVGADVSAVRFVPVDLVAGDLDAELERAGHEPGRPSLLLVEGLLGYLPRPVAHRLLSDLRRRAAAGSRLAAAFPVVPADVSSSGPRLRHWLRRRLVAAVGEPWVNVYTSSEVDAEFAAAGWSVRVEHDRPQRYEGHRGVLVLGEPAAPSGVGPQARASG